LELRSVMPGTPKGILTYNKIAETDVSVYKGVSPVGMAGSTPVTLLLKPGKAFEVITTAPRGVGSYEIGDDGRIVLTYLDPSARPDGTEFQMFGTTENNDVSVAGNVIVIETVEYTVQMGPDPSVLNLQEVEFTLDN